MIKIEQLSYAYLKHNVIENINLEIKKGEFVLLLGDNGSGKTTLIKCITDLLKDYKGSIKRTERVSYLPQITEVQNNFPATVEEVVLSGTIASGVKRFFYNKKDKETRDLALAQMNIEDIRKVCFRELSGGQKQRVLLARALCGEAKILILDEPTNGLDPSIASEVYELLHELNKENQITIILVSHDVDRAINYADRIVEMKKGEIVFNDKKTKYKNGSML